MSALEDRKQERFWSQLLDLVSKGNVVPVIGEELLQVSAEPNGTTLYPALAERYAAASEITLEKPLKGNLSATVRRHPDFFTSPFRIYQDIAAEYQALAPPIPETLRALAKIRHFNLFVTTTFDDLLERALNQERFAGQERTEAIAFAPNNVPTDQAIDDALARKRPLIFQFFGSYKTPGQYALTEGDMVEYVHSLEANRKSRIVSELYERPLLLIGNSFPDWLTRILLRMARNDPLDRSKQQQYVVDAQVLSDAHLRFFLRNFVVNTQIVEGMSAAEFVDELSKKWLARFGSDAAAAEAAMPVKSRPMPKNAVFISYCRSDASHGPTPDAKAALAIRDALEARGVEVWLDKDRLEGGDDYERKIQRYIDTCSLFIPLISETTDSRDKGYFRKEWTWAISRLPYFTGSDRHFVVPVLIGPSDWRPVKVPQEFNQMHYVRLPPGEIETAFLDHVQSLYEKARASDQ
jgi:hypothetical protein